MARSKEERYIVTGPGISDPAPSYADPGPALSRALTAACRSEVEGTWYARDAITDTVIGYAETTVIEGGRPTVNVVRH